MRRTFGRPVAALLVGTLANALWLVAPAPAGAMRTSGTNAELTKAKKALLELRDFPKGWESMESSDNGPTLPGAAELASCIGVPTAVIASEPPSASSPEFQSPNKMLIVDDRVSVYGSSKAAKAAFAAERSPKTPGCLTTILNGPAKAGLASGLGSGATVGTVQVVRAPASEFAPHNAGFIAYLPVTAMGQTLNFQLTVVDYVRRARDQELSLISVEQPFPTSLARHLTAAAAGRL